MEHTLYKIYYFISLLLQRLEEMKLLQEQVEKAERRHAAVDEQVIIYCAS